MTTPSIPQKQCTKCKQFYPATNEYFRLIKHRNHLHAKCRPCEHEHDAEIRRNNPERIQRNQEQFRKRNPERAKEIKRSWAERNVVKIKQKNMRYYARNKDTINARNNEYDAKHPEKKRARTEKRRKLSKQAEGNFTEHDLQRLYEDQERRCAYCGISIYWHIPNDIHVDHVQPLSKGGSNWPDNLCLACADCNLSKGEKSVIEWMQVRGW